MSTVIASPHVRRRTEAEVAADRVKALRAKMLTIEVGGVLYWNGSRAGEAAADAHFKDVDGDAYDDDSLDGGYDEDGYPDFDDGLDDDVAHATFADGMWA